MKRLWYHCTVDDHGDTWTSRLRAPLLRSAKEDATPRLCVGPTIADCLAARLFHPGPVHVYTVRCGAVSPRSVWDAGLTTERWVIHRATLTRLKTIDVSHLYASTLLALEVMRTRGETGIPWRLRAAQLILMHEHFGTKKTWVKFSKQYLGIDDPDEFILNYVQSHPSRSSLRVLNNM